MILVEAFLEARYAEEKEILRQGIARLMGDQDGPSMKTGSRFYFQELEGIRERFLESFVPVAV